MSALVALIDGPLDAADPSPAARHAAAMAAAIREHAPEATLLGFTVFDGRLATSADRVAEALAEAAAARPAVILCAFGLVRPDPAIIAHVAAALEAGACVAAAAPARGDPVWPAAAPGVASAQGDARCGSLEWSLLDLPGAAFGACPRLDAFPDVAGASVAAARLAGLLAARRAEGLSGPEAVAALRAGARFVGRERRGLDASAAPR